MLEQKSKDMLQKMPKHILEKYYIYMYKIQEKIKKNILQKKIKSCNKKKQLHRIIFKKNK